MEFEKKYFTYLNYSKKGQLIARHILESLRWASSVLNQDLLNGDGKSALDAGCAFGYGVDVLHSLRYEAWGTDISSYGLIQAKRNVNDNVFVVCDAQNSMPFTKRFNVVTCFEMLEHLPNPARALRSLYEASCDVILCTTPNKTVEQVFKKMARNFDKTHINVKTPSEWETLIHKTLNCKRIVIDSFVDLSFQFVNASFYKSFKLPFGMETRIAIEK